MDANKQTIFIGILYVLQTVLFINIDEKRTSWFFISNLTLLILAKESILTFRNQQKDGCVIGSIKKVQYLILVWLYNIKIARKTYSAIYCWEHKVFIHVIVMMVTTCGGR